MTNSIDNFDSSECKLLQYHEGYKVLVRVSEYLVQRYRQFDEIAEATEPSSTIRGSTSAYGDILERLILEVGRYRDET